MEFLMGRSLLNTLYNLGIKDQYMGELPPLLLLRLLLFMSASAAVRSSIWMHWGGG
jgi:hypothetical protein